MSMHLEQSQKRRLKCEACGQTHMRKAEIIVSQGTRRGYSSGPRYTVSNFNETDMAAQLKPKIKKDNNLFFNVISVIVTFIVIVSVKIAAPADWGFIKKTITIIFCSLTISTALFMLLAAIFPSINDLLDNTEKENQRIMTDFKKTWVCMDCGHTQIIENNP